MLTNQQAIRAKHTVWKNFYNSYKHNTSFPIHTLFFIREYVQDVGILLGLKEEPDKPHPNQLELFKVNPLTKELHAIAK